MKGIITSGKKKGGRFISIPGYINQIRERLGINPYIGTLNMIVDTAIIKELKQINGIELHGFEYKRIQYGAVKCYPVQISNVNAYVLLPNKSTYDNVLEFVAEECMRDLCCIHDGDAMEFQFLPFITKNYKMMVWSKPFIGGEISPITIFYDSFFESGHRDLCTYKLQDNMNQDLPVYKKTIPERSVVSHIFQGLPHIAFQETEKFLCINGLSRMSPPRQILHGLLNEWQIEVKLSPK